MTTKKCSNCQLEKTINFFYKKEPNSLRFSNLCNECEKLRQRNHKVYVKPIDLPDEIWKDIPYLKGQTVNKYVVSNLGRVATYTDHIKELTILQPSLVDNMYRIIIRIKNKSKSLYPYQAVAAVFLKQPKTTQKHLIHLDYDKTNNVVANLKWVTNEEYYEYRTKKYWISD